MTRTVRDMMEQEDARKFLTHHYRLMAWRGTEEEFGEILTLLQKDDSEVLPLIVRYLTTGTEAARESVDVLVSKTFGDIIMTRTNALRSGRKSWKEQCPDAWSPHFTLALRQVWNAMNLLEESGCRYEDTDSYIWWLTSTQLLTEIAPKSKKQGKDDSYWRGLAAITLVQLINEDEIFFNNTEVISQLNGFILLVGTCPDLQAVMRFAVERNMYDATALRALTEDSEIIRTAVGEGVL